MRFDPNRFGKPEAGKESKIEQTKPKSKRSTMLKRRHQNVYRRAFSETQLLDLMDGENFEKGYSYHFITGGDVDALSYLKIILRQQDLEYCLFSTWVMAHEDICQIEEWLEAGKIKKLDAYVGETFSGTYKLEYAKLKGLITAHGGRVAVFRNHSKIFAGHGKKFAFGVETSANINTNPRTENGCITIDRALFDFYYEYFNGIKSYDQP